MASAASLWQAQNIRAAMTKLGKGWTNLHPEVKRRAELVIRDANKEFEKDGLKIGAFEGWRTIPRQLSLMSGGTSWVGDPLSSYHPWGLAVDFVFINKLGLWTWTPNYECGWWNPFCDTPWERLGAIIKKHGFEWGGDWKNFDGPHAQLPIRRTSQLKVMYNGPSDFIRTFA